jgi:hypothetical protein
MPTNTFRSLRGHLAAEGPIKCAVLTSLRHYRATSITLTCPDSEFVSLHRSALGLDRHPNPFALPEEPHADVALVSPYCHHWVRERGAE